jgi:uncharacterized membrane protein required for colicin V production
MDFGICGLLDIIIVVLGLIVILLGYRKGFLKKVLSIVGFFAIAILAFVYCKQFAAFLIQKNFIYPNIYNPILEHLLQQTVEAGLQPNSSLVDLLTVGLGLPDVMARVFANVLNVSGDLNQICSGISQYISTVAMNIISFLIILVGTSVVVLILKIIADAIRKVKVVRIIDGFLGAILYFSFFLLFVYVCFSFIQIAMEQTWFADAKAFLIVDMKLPINGEETPYRLSRFIYENNVLYKLIEMFI